MFHIWEDFKRYLAARKANREFLEKQSLLPPEPTPPPAKPRARGSAQAQTRSAQAQPRSTPPVPHPPAASPPTVTNPTQLVVQPHMLPLDQYINYLVAQHGHQFDDPPRAHADPPQRSDHRKPNPARSSPPPAKPRPAPPAKRPAAPPPASPPAHLRPAPPAKRPPASPPAHLRPASPQPLPDDQLRVAYLPSGLAVTIEGFTNHKAAQHAAYHAVQEYHAADAGIPSPHDLPTPKQALLLMKNGMPLYNACEYPRHEIPDFLFRMGCFTAAEKQLAESNPGALDQLVEYHLELEQAEELNLELERRARAIIRKYKRQRRARERRARERLERERFERELLRKIDDAEWDFWEYEQEREEQRRRDNFINLLCIGSLFQQ